MDVALFYIMQIFYFILIYSHVRRWESNSLYTLQNLNKNDYISFGRPTIGLTYDWHQISSQVFIWELQGGKL